LIFHLMFCQFSSTSFPLKYLATPFIEKSCEFPQMFSPSQNRLCFARLCDHLTFKSDFFARESTSQDQNETFEGSQSHCSEWENNPRKSSYSNETFHSSSISSSLNPANLRKFSISSTGSISSISYRTLIRSQLWPSPPLKRESVCAVSLLFWNSIIFPCSILSSEEEWSFERFVVIPQFPDIGCSTPSVA
jgi:hypothetical protein